MPNGLDDRFWEIDCLRGVAIVMMVSYHLAWDLAFVGLADIDVVRGGWLVFQRATATIFLLLVGVSLQLSGTRARLAQRSQRAVWRRQIRRGFTVLGWGMMVSLITWIVLREAFVRFGILHLIGVSLLLASPFLALGVWNLVLGAGLIVVGGALQTVTVDGPWLLWLGLRPADFATVDYYPLLPWFGVVLIGLGLGQLLYRDYVRQIALPDLAGAAPVRLLRWLGQHALAIYLLHQPVLFMLLAPALLTHG